MSFESHEITDAVEFEALQKARIGWIVNVDEPTRTNTVHRAGCDQITVESYTQKVIDGRGSTGRYLHFLWVEDAEPVINLRRCARCRESNERPLRGSRSGPFADPTREMIAATARTLAAS